MFEGFERKLVETGKLSINCVIVGAGPGTPTYMLIDVIMQRVGMTVAEELNFRTLTDTAAMNGGIRGGQIDSARVGFLDPADDGGGQGECGARGFR